MASVEVATAAKSVVDTCGVPYRLSGYTPRRKL
jgi:hypothetical protein